MIILHIGFPKTASTALQLLFSSNADTLVGQGLYYPLTGKDFKQRSLKSLLRKAGQSFNTPTAAAKEDLALLHDRVVGYSGPAVLLSCEELTNAQDFDISAEGLSVLAAYLAKMGRDIRIVAYVRNPVEYYLSRMQEKLKSSAGVVPPSTFLPLFSASIAAFETAFETQAIVRPFHRADLVGGSIVSDFFTAIEDIISIDQQHLIDRQVNETLSAEVMFLLDILRRGMADERRVAFSRAEGSFLWRELGRIDQMLGPTQKPVLYRDAAAAVVAAVRPDVAQLQAQRGLKLRPHVALDIDCPLPSEARLASVETIVPVDRSRAFTVWRLLTQRMVSSGAFNRS